MVNTTVNTHPNPFVNMRRELPWPPPQAGDGFEHTREISFQIWDLDEIQTIARSCIDGVQNAIFAITKDCILDMQQEKLTNKDVAELLLLLEPDDYVNSRWCMSSPRPGVTARPELRWFPCDAYTLPIQEEDEYGVASEKKYYIKVSRNIAGKMLLMISMHPSKF